MIIKICHIMTVLDRYYYFQRVLFTYEIRKNHLLASDPAPCLPPRVDA